MSQDLSHAFGRPATSSLRGLLPPRGGARWSGPPEDEDDVDLPPPDGAEDGEWEDDEPEDDGFDEDGPEEDEPVDDEAVDDGPVDDGPVDDGPVDDGPVDDGPVDDEPTARPAAPLREQRPAPATRRTTAASVRPTSSGTNRRWGRVRVTARDHVDLLVLLALRAGPADGRGVITRLRETSDGALDAPERTVHVTLHRLARNRLLGRRLDRTSGRRVYVLTEAGQRATRARLREWQALTRGVDAVARAGG